MTTDLKKLIKNELQNLPKLHTGFEEFKSESSENNLKSIEQLIETVKDDVKKGNRANFKLMQELDLKLEEIKSVTNTSNEKDEEHQNEVDQWQHLAIHLFDLIDRIYKATSTMEDNSIKNEVEKVREQALHLLEGAGLERINVEGKMIDGKTMISLGNVPRNTYAPELDPYHVYSIHQEGFRDKKNDKIIRKATVITVE